MKFDYRQALENIPKTIKYYQTPEGKAERFLKESINTMAQKNISIEEVSEMYLGLSSSPYEHDIKGVRLFFSYLPKDTVKKIEIDNKGIPNINEYTSIYAGYIKNSNTKGNFLEDMEEGISVFEIIEKELKSKGFNFEDLSFYRKRFHNLHRFRKITF